MSKRSAADLKNSTLLQLYARARAPSRDYYGLTIAETCICLNIWKITHGPHCFPKQKFCEIIYFHEDKYLQEEIKNTFGDSVFDYIKNLCCRKRNLENVPRRAFLKIAQYLGVNDLLKLARTNKIFYELCNKEEIWQIIFRKTLRRFPSPEEKRMAFDCGWKETLKRRISYIKQALETTKKKTFTSEHKTASIKTKKCVLKAK